MWKIGSLRTLSSKSLNNAEWIKSGKDKKNLKNFNNCEFVPIKLKSGQEDIPVLYNYPPDPLHVNLLGPVNSALEKSRRVWQHPAIIR